MDVLPNSMAVQEAAPLWSDFWLVRLIFNFVGYSSIVLPGYFLIQYFKRRKHLDKGHGICFPLVRVCVFGNEKAESTEDHIEIGRAEMAESSASQQALRLVICIIGLQASYLTWGVLQERVMTRTYGKGDSTVGERFNDSQFLVFMNRVLAFATAGMCCLVTQQPRHGVPMYKYSFCSLSNILSSWCQYEALKFVSFPTQVLAKASKVIPVMLMGKVVSKKTYEHWEYCTAGLISVGVSMFLLSRGDEIKHSSTVTTFSGLIIMASYILFDSFTSNWQDVLFKYKMSSIQMMFGVNLFSCLFTVSSLLEQGALVDSLAFMGRHIDFALHAVLLSICSTFGQLFIFYTINHFGAAIFTLIMTTRQALAILLSCLLYGHHVHLTGVLGIMTVFAALFMRVYARSRIKKKTERSLPPAQKI
uniref:Adenosine 3'-phospho 5'-phosphosulfate transporter 1 n=2 Tax=Eptatretus burgeri TaxID=7764 RepID=A0A8C4N1G8_EPTBU